MAKADAADERRQSIAAAIRRELARQGHSDTPLDIAALVAAIDSALTPVRDEGRHPDELNATNDD